MECAFATFRGDLAYGVFPPTAYQWADAWIDLWSDRDWLHDGVWHHRHDQLRPRRYLHDRRFYLAVRLSDPDERVGLRLSAGGSADRYYHRDAFYRRMGLVRRAHSLSAVARFVPPRAVDHRDRHVHCAAKLRADHARSAREAVAAASSRRHYADSPV